MSSVGGPRWESKEARETLSLMLSRCPSFAMHSPWPFPRTPSAWSFVWNSVTLIRRGLLKKVRPHFFPHSPLGRIHREVTIIRMFRVAFTDGE